MTTPLQQHDDAIAALCRRFHVRSLDLFGSSTTGQRHAGM